MPEEIARLNLQEVLDRFLHKLTALHEVLPLQMAVVSHVAEDAEKRHRQFLNENGELLEEDKTSASYKLQVKHIRKAHRLAKRSERAHSVLDLIPRNVVVSFVSEYDSFLGALITEILKFKPEIIDSKDKNISLSDLVALGSVEAAREKIIAKEVEAVLRSSHAEQFVWLESSFNIRLREGLDSWPTFVEITERRNLFVHCDGMISEQYLNVCSRHGVTHKDSVAVGQKLGADQKYLRSTFETLYEIGLKLAQVLWRKLDPSSIGAAESSLSYFTYELLIDKNYRLAKRLFDFACCSLKKWESESVRLIYVVNRALAYKFSGNEGECSKILDSQDWSAVGDNYKVCVAVLRDDFDDAKSIMERIGNSGVVSESDYLEWPCFREFRDSTQFSDGFEIVFGYPPSIIEQVDKVDEDKRRKTLNGESAGAKIDDKEAGSERQ